MSRNYENFIPRKAYWCPCLMHLVNEFYNVDICGYSAILETISKSCINPKQGFRFCVENKTSSMIMCQAHLILTLLSKTKYECTSHSDNDFLVIPLQRRYCKSSIRHYCENMCNTDSWYFLVVLIEKMLKKFKVCDCFLDIACYCLEINAYFAQFQKECLRLRGWKNEMFIIKNTRRESVSSDLCCLLQEICWFQIDLFIQTDLFPLRTFDCRCTRDKLIVLVHLFVIPRWEVICCLKDFA